jgi:hypothetical protein
MNPEPCPGVGFHPIQKIPKQRIFWMVHWWVLLGHSSRNLELLLLATKRGWTVSGEAFAKARLIHRHTTFLAVDCFLNLKSQTWNNNLPHTLYNTCP